DYYFSYYKESNNRYKTEFIFQPVGKDGLVMYLYLYDQGNNDHRSDIMFVTRLLETGAEEG
ncbi:MAG: hypothetical protein K6E33_02685, partial [Lachnospiraceae bacterium]|nr:hypothetical protein [Lachnospiraceae bacterium]